MSIQEIVSLVALGVIVVGGIIGLFIAIIRGEMKNFIIEKMEEAEEFYKELPKPEKSKKKFQYVIDAINNKYGIKKLFLNAKKFIEKIAEIINSKR